MTTLYNALPTEFPANLNGHIIGRIMRDAVSRAIQAIRAVRFTFVPEVKGKKDDGGDDFVTTADKAAQEKIVRALSEAFPLFGIISEEDDLRKPCTVPGMNIYFTIDPLDGTSAFKRMQSHGFGPMISLVVNGRVVAACIGDANTGEMFYYRPDSPKVHRLVDFGHQQVLAIDPDRSLCDQYALLRDGPGEFSPLIQKLVRPRSEGGKLKGMETANGSIGLSFSRLWKGEVGMKILKPGKQTPWDTTPIFGINAMLGMVAVRVISDRGPMELGIEPFDPGPFEETERWEHEVIVLHRSRLHELEELFSV